MTTQEPETLVAATTTDLASKLKAGSYGRTFCQYSSSSKYAALSAFGRAFSTTLAGLTLTMRLVWREGVGWVLDLLDNNDAGIVTGIALVSGVDLLAQYSHLQLGFKLVVACDDASQEYPTKTDLGINSHLYVLTE